MQSRKVAVAIFAAALAFLAPQAANAQSQAAGTQYKELKVFGSRVTKVILGELGPQFEKATGFRPEVTADVAQVMKRRIEGGEAFDLAVLVDFQINDLIKSGKLFADTRADIMSSSIGVAVKRGAPKPDISTVDAFKQTLLNAKSITYLKEGREHDSSAQGVQPARHHRGDQGQGGRDAGRAGVGVRRRGQGRTRADRHSQHHVGPGRGGGRSSAGRDQLHHHVHRSRVGADSPNQQVARELIKLMKSPEAKPVIKAKGNDPA